MPSSDRPDRPERAGKPPLDDRAPGQPPGYKLPQRTLEGVVRESANGHIVTFHIPLLGGLIDLGVVVAVPRPGSTKVPVYVRVFIDKSKGDAPGSVVVR